MKAANAIICVSEAMASVVRPLMPHSDIRVVTNGFDDSIFRLEGARRDLGVLFVGLLVPVKNVHLVLRAYARLREHVDTPLTIAGDGPLRAELESLATQLGIADSTRFIGYKSRADIARLMQRARVLVLPSSSEGWGMVVAEALACGTPVIASRVGGVPEILVSDESGILVTPDDEDALFAALENAFAREWKPQLVAAGSGARPWSVQATRIAEVYQELLAVASPGGAR